MTSNLFKNTQRVKLFLASKGNQFMNEIAQIFVEGFQANQVRAELVFDQLPSPRPRPGLAQIIIAPHEFYPLFVESCCTPEEVRVFTSACYLLNVEQPGSMWFELAYQHARYALGVLDINKLGVEEFKKRGIQAHLTPLGYASILEAGVSSISENRPVDLVFMGHHSFKREMFFSRYADFFNRYNCRLIFSNLDVRHSETPGFYADQKRNELLKSSKLLLNLHSSTRNYFEWHRALIAISNQCLLVTETSDHIAPLVNGHHIVMTELDELVEACQYYLENAAERVRLVTESYNFITQHLNAESICRDLLEYLNTPLDTSDIKVASVELSQPTQKITTFLIEPPAASTVSASFIRRLVRRTIQSFLLLVAKPDHSPNYSNPVAQLLPDSYLPKVELEDLRAEIQQLKISQDPLLAKREAIVRRIELATQCEVLGHNPWTVISNQAYHECGSPSVTVIITLFNYADYIQQCLDSVCRSYREGLPDGYEVVVIDDGSTDNSAQLVETYMKQTVTPMALVKKVYNTGLGDARNVGLKSARASNVFILDADNWIYPNCLAQLYETLVAEGCVGVFGIINKFENKSGKSVGLTSFYEWNEQKLVQGPYIDAMAMFQRDALLRIGGYSTELIQYGWLGWEDYDLFLKLAQTGYRCKLLPQILTAYRVHHTSMLANTNQYLENMSNYFAKKFSDLVKKHDGMEMYFGVEPKQYFHYKPTKSFSDTHSLESEYEGYLDTVNHSIIRGWAWDKHQPNRILNLEIFDKNNLLEVVRADIFRQDLLYGGIGSGAHGFMCLPPADLHDLKSHSIKVRIADTNFYLPDTTRH